MLNGTWLKISNKNRDVCYYMFNIIKDPEQALLRHRESMMETRQDHEKLVATATATEPANTKVPMYTKTEAFTFAGSPQSVTQINNCFDRQFQSKDGYRRHSGCNENWRRY